MALLQRVLHPRLRAMLGESNLAVRQVRNSMTAVFEDAHGQLQLQHPVL